MKKHPIRFGLTSYGASSAKEWQRKIERVEELSYSTLLVPDHFVEQIATIPALALAAAYSKTLRVGSLVCNHDFRHPVLLAKEAATIDMLSNGRFELGLGAGWLKPEYDAIGLLFDTPGKRVARFEEAVQVIKAYFKDEPINFNGVYFQVNDKQGLDKIPEPVQKPHPPILIGAGGKRMLSIAAREADIIGLAIKVQADGSGPDPRDIAITLAQKIEWVRDEAGERFDDIEFNIQTWAVVITDNRELVANQLAAQFPLPSQMLLNIPYVLIGTEEEIIDQIEKYRDQLGISYYSVFERHMEEFAPIVAHFASRIQSETSIRFP